MLSQVLLNGLVTGFGYSLLGLGFSLIYNTTGVFHIAYGATYTLGGYMTFQILKSTALPLPAAILLSLLAVGAMGGAMELSVYSRLDQRGSPRIILLLSSLGLYSLVVGLITLVFGNATHSLVSGEPRTIALGNLVLTLAQSTQLFLGLCVGAVAFWVFSRTTAGIVLRAVGDDSQAAAAWGVDVFRTRLLSVMIGSSLGALPAILSALDIGLVPHRGMLQVLVSATVLILGGPSSYTGTILAGVVLGTVQALAIWYTSSRWAELVVFFVLLLALAIRADELVAPARRQEEEYT